jgi:hypothetical protein
MCIVFKVENRLVDGGMFSLDSRFGYYNGCVKKLSSNKNVQERLRWSPYFRFYIKLYRGTLTDDVISFDVPTGNKIIGNETIGLILFNNS